MWSDVMELFRNYMGTGMIVIWYLISLIYLWINEKRMHVRILFLYVPIALLLVYFNPLSVKLVHGVVGSDIYWRILWLLPVSATIACASTASWRGAGKNSGRTWPPCAWWEPSPYPEGSCTAAPGFPGRRIYTTCRRP